MLAEVIYYQTSELRGFIPNRPFYLLLTETVLDLRDHVASSPLLTNCGGSFGRGAYDLRPASSSGSRSWPPIQAVAVSRDADG